MWRQVKLIKLNCNKSSYLIPSPVIPRPVKWTFLSLVMLVNFFDFN